MDHSRATTLGLDIGGANLKAAHADSSARTVPFPLWKHPERLTAELTALCARMPGFDRLAVTMTGELCDCFETRRDGVRAILRSVAEISRESPVHVWCNQGRFLGLEEACELPLAVAAANWLALAHFVASLFPKETVLLIDTGSTTTDIIYLKHGVPQPRGLTDRERLASGELVYTGVRRTPICAVLGMQVAAEFFATMLDAYVFLGLIPEASEDRHTADGRPATRKYAHARLARAMCADASSFSESDARTLAQLALETQQHGMQQAIEQVLAEKPSIERIVLAGSGEIVGHSTCARCQTLAALPITSLGEYLGPEISSAACACAVAMLLSKEPRR